MVPHAWYILYLECPLQVSSVVVLGNIRGWSHAGEKVRLTKGTLGWGIEIPTISLLWFLLPGTMRCATGLCHVSCLDVLPGYSLR